MGGLSIDDRAVLIKMLGLWQPLNWWQQLLKGWLLTQLARD